MKPLDGGDARLILEDADKAGGGTITHFARQFLDADVMRFHDFMQTLTIGKR